MLLGKKNEYRSEKNISRICWGNFLKVTDKSIAKIMNSQLDIKLREFTEEEFNVLLTKIKSRKAAGLNKIPPEVWKTRKFKLLFFFFFFFFAMLYINKIQ